MGQDGPDAVLDRATFDDFAGLFDDAELREVIDDWYADSLKALAALDAARAAGDSARIGDLAHGAAGGGMAIGAIALALACERLRASAESGGSITDGELAAVREAVAATYAALTDATAASP